MVTRRALPRGETQRERGGVAIRSSTATPALLVDGCNWCPDGYRACAGQCWRLLDANTNFWSAATACAADSNKFNGEPKYIAIPSPRNSDEDRCAYDFSTGWGVWLGYILQFRELWSLASKSWADYKGRNFMSYTPWASGEPSWWGNEPNVVLIPVYDPVNRLNHGWHDWNAQGPFRALCATRYCIDKP